MVAGYAFPGVGRRTPKSVRSRSVEHAPPAAIKAYERRVRGLALQTDPDVDEWLPRVGGFKMKGKLRGCSSGAASLTGREGGEGGWEGGGEGDWESSRCADGGEANMPIHVSPSLPPSEASPILGSVPPLELSSSPAPSHLARSLPSHFSLSGEGGRGLSWEARKRAEEVEQAAVEKTKLVTRLFQVELSPEMSTDD
ncbi:MAG: hypothetical protein SGPRY_013512 [Prymnesium sp.]